MAVLPPYDPNLKPDEPDLDPTGRRQAEPDVKYVMASEAAPEDRMTAIDKMAVVAAIGCAQFIRLLIIAAAIGLIILVFFVVSHV